MPFADVLIFQRSVLGRVCSSLVAKESLGNQVEAVVGSIRFHFRTQTSNQEFPGVLLLRRRLRQYRIFVGSKNSPT